MANHIPWIALFSQTGSEILEVSKKLGRTPDLIITNRRPKELREINAELMQTMGDLIVEVSNRPALQEYLTLIEQYSKPMVTLHGWLRILPEKICDEYTIYNGHPGDIISHPELKGKDPQEQAFSLKMPYAGCVIHEVIPEVDAGNILISGSLPIKGLSLGEVYEKLHTLSVDLWVVFLRDIFYENSINRRTRNR